MVTVTQALRRYANSPTATEVTVDQKVYEIIPFILFTIANSPNKDIRGSSKKATTAQKMIFTRLVGTRRPGSRPLSPSQDNVEFVDLTDIPELPL